MTKGRKQNMGTGPGQLAQRGKRQLAQRGKSVSPSRSLSDMKKFARRGLGGSTSLPGAPQSSREDDRAVINYGDTIRLQSLAEDGYLFADGYELDDVMWRPAQTTSTQKGSSDLSSAAAAQFTIVTKHTYDKAKLLKKALNQMAVESLHEIRAKQMEEDINVKLIQAAYELQEPVEREKRHNLAEVSRSLGSGRAQGGGGRTRQQPACLAEAAQAT